MTFAERLDKTELTLRMMFASAGERETVKRLGAIEGSEASLDRLGEQLARMRHSKKESRHGNTQRAKR